MFCQLDLWVWSADDISPDLVYFRLKTSRFYCLYNQTPLLPYPLLHTHTNHQVNSKEECLFENYFGLAIMETYWRILFKDTVCKN